MFIFHNIICFDSRSSETIFFRHLNFNTYIANVVEKNTLSSNEYETSPECTDHHNDLLIKARSINKPIKKGFKDTCRTTGGHVTQRLFYKYLNTIFMILKNIVNKVINEICSDIKYLSDDNVSNIIFN